MQTIALIDDMVESSADVVGAFLSPIYPRDKPHILGEPRGCWYRVLKYIYSLPDAGKAFYEMYRDHLVEHGYMPTISDPCLFYFIKDKDVSYIWIHVDGTCVCGSNQCLINQLFDVLRK